MKWNIQNKKQLLCSIGKTAAFFCILLFLIKAAGVVVTPKDNTASAGMEEERANGILAEPANTIDVAIVGDSESYSAISPLEMWKTYGITSYVCGTPGQRMEASWGFLKEIFKTQKPKIVMLETNELYRETSPANWLFKKMETYMPVFHWHDRWKTLKTSDFSDEVSYTHIEKYKGFQICCISDSASDDSYMQPTDEKEAIPFLNQLILREIIHLCEQNGAQLVLVSIPSVKNWNMARHNAVTELANNLGIPFEDLNVKSDEVAITWSTDSRDKGDHVNYYGAVKISAYIGKWLNENAKLADHRSEDAYASWNEALTIYAEDVKNQQKT